MNRFPWKTSGTRPRISHVVALTGLSLLAVLAIWRPQHLAAKEQYSEDQIADEFTSMVKYEAEAMETWLSIALHEEVPCDGSCNRDNNFSSIVPVIVARCERFDPEAQEQSPYYKRSLHGEDLDRLKAACSILTNTAKNTLDANSQSPLRALEASSPSTLSIPESPEWVEAVSRARAVFR